MPALSILVLHGPNLNLLGLREPGIYGSLTLAEINRLLESKAMELQAELLFVQSNHEGVLVDAIHEALGKYQGIVINAGSSIFDSRTMCCLPSGLMRENPIRLARSFSSITLINCIAGAGTLP